MVAILALFDFALNILWWVVIVHALMSWLIGMQILNTTNNFVAYVWYYLNRILEPIYSKIREFIPQMGILDLSPLVLIFGIIFLRYFILSIV